MALCAGYGDIKTVVIQVRRSHTKQEKEGFKGEYGEYSEALVFCRISKLLILKGLWRRVGDSNPR